MTRFLVVLCAMALAACATATPYQPVATAHSAGYGYAEKRIETNRYTITFNGNALTERETVESYLLYRAAELTLEQGYDYFIVAQRSTDDNSRLLAFGGPSHFGFYPSYSWYSPRYGWHPFYDPLWRDDTSYREVTRYEATAEIVLFKGQKPAADPQAFDARQVKENLGANITRQTPG
jgi:hypothetical protein